VQHNKLCVIEINLDVVHSVFLNQDSSHHFIEALLFDGTITVRVSTE